MYKNRIRYIAIGRDKLQKKRYIADASTKLETKAHVITKNRNIPIKK